MAASNAYAHNNEFQGTGLSNHISHHGAFASSLSSFSQNLDNSIREIRDQRRNDGNNEDYVFSEASVFLGRQHERLENIERSLMLRIEDILPQTVSVDKDLMTAAELVQICQSLHRMNVGFARHLEATTSAKERSEASGNTDATSTIRTSLHTDHANTTRFSTNGLPVLERVVEAGYETDATNTPGSALVRDQGTPASICVDRRGLSESRIRNRPSMNIRSPSQTSDLIESWRANKSFTGAPSHHDDIVTKEASVDVVDEYMHNFADGVEAWRARQSDASVLYHPRDVSNAMHSDDHQSYLGVEPSLADGQQEKDRWTDNDSVITSTVEHDEESVSLAPTVKGRGFFKKQALDQLKQVLDVEPYHDFSQPTSDVPFAELLVDEGAPSCLTHHDITFDQSVLDESPPSPRQSRIYVADESLLVTPVLARYRLEPDDSSIGVKVVPTGRHRLQHAGKSRENAVSQHSHAQRKSNASQTPKRQESLRLTVQPGKENALHRIEEVLSPNVSARTPLRSKKFEFGEDIYETKEFISRPIQPIKESVPERILFAKNTPSEKLKKTSAVGPRASRNSEEVPLRGRRQTVDSVGELLSISVVSVEEYHAAPSVVRMQVGLEEVNEAVHALNLWFSAHYGSERSPRLNEEMVSRVLNTSPRKGKILMMSLCHWRRMNMSMDEETGIMVFVPNQKLSSPRLTM